MGALTAVLAGLVAFAVLAAFVRLEREGRPDVVLGVIVAALVLDGLLVPSQGVIRNSLFYIRVAGEDVRLPDVLLPLALLARLWVRGLPSRVTALGGAWAAFLVWYATAAVIGHLQGNATAQIIFHSKSILYIGGGMALAAGVPAVRLIGARTAAGWAAVLGVAMAIVVPLTLLDVSFPIGLPLLAIPSFGTLGPDGATVVLSLAVVLLVLECSRRHPRARVSVPLALVVLGTLTTVQRATMLNVAVVAFALLVAAAGATWRRRMQVSPTDGALFVSGLIGVGVALALVSVIGAEENPVAAIYVDAFTSEANLGSAEARISIWSESWALLRDRPAFGWGLGKQVFLVRPYPLAPVELAAHNILWDVVVRSGIVGLALFLVAVASALRSGLRTWRTTADPRVAALALAAVVALTGVLGKGLVESVLEKYRIALAIGLLLGVLASAAADRRTRGDADAPDIAGEDRTTVG